MILQGPFEEPAWLTAKVDQRLAFMLQEMGGKLPNIGQNVVLTLLTEYGEGATQEEKDRWERTCDNCGLFCPGATTFYTGQVARYHMGKRVEFTFGSCPKCVGRSTPMQEARDFNLRVMYARRGMHESHRRSPGDEVEE
jgi:hypothetical protein